MKTRLLLSASLVVLIGSLGLARADMFDDVASHLGVIEAAAPADEVSKTSTANIKAVNDSVAAVNDAKAKAGSAAADLANAQAAAGIGNTPPDQAYQAQANKVANQLDVLDGLKKMADGGDIKKNLDAAVAQQKTAEYWNNEAYKAVKATANLPPTDPKRKEALDGYANAQKLMAQAQYLAGVAADAASAALKDPKSAEAQLRDKIVSATSDYNDLKASLDKLNAVKNATVALQRANDDVTAKKADATAKAVTAINSVNADMTAAEAAKKAAAAAKPVVLGTTPGLGTTPAGAGSGSAGLISIVGGTVIGNDGHSLITNDGGTLITNDGGTLISNKQSGIVSTSGSGLITNDGATVISNDGHSLISNKQSGIVSTSGSGLITNDGATVISNDGHSLISNKQSGIISTNSGGLISNSASAMMQLLSTPGATVATSTGGFKQDSVISANSNSTYQTPAEQLAGKIKNNLSAADQKTLNAMITDVKAGKTLTPAQEAQAASLLNQAAKGLDPAAIKSLQQTATVKTAVSNANAAVAAAVVNQAITTAKNDPAVAAAVQNLQAGKPLTAAQQSSLNTAISSTVSNLQVPDAQKQTLTQTAATQVATATVPKTALAPAPLPAVEIAAYTPAMVRQLVTAGPAVIQGLQSQQALAIAKGDKTTADALGRDISSLQGQIDTAKKIAVANPPPAPGNTAPATHPPGSATAGVQAAAVTAVPATQPATNAAPGSQPTGPVTAAAQPAAATAAPAAKPATESALAAPAAPTAPKTEALPAKITAEQGKAVQHALRTIPGNLTRTEQKDFANLSALVDRATTKGLTPEEARTLKAGLAALAQKHPKAEKQAGLTAIGSHFEAHKPEGSAATRTTGVEPAASTGAKTAVTTPVAMPAVASPGKPAPATTAASTPAVAVATPRGDGRVDSSHDRKDLTPEHHIPPRIEQTKTDSRDVPKEAPKPATPPTGAKQPAVTATQPQKGFHTDEIKPHAASPAVTPKPSAQPAPSIHPVATPKVQPAAPAAPPRPALASTTAPAVKPPAPAPKAQTCTPNMVNGKMQGMICH